MMFHNKPYELSGPNYLDKSGYSIVIPAIYQMPPFWWEDDPETYERILKAREVLNITVDDWDGQKRPERPADGPWAAHPDAAPPTDGSGPQKGAQR